MGSRYRSPSVEEIGNDDKVEVALVDVDLTSEETEAVGPVDIYESTRNRARFSSSATRPQVRPQAQVIEIHQYKLRDNTHVCPQDFVELVCPQHRQAGAESSGDIIRVKSIFRYRLTGEVTIKGHRFMRERYVIGTSFQGEHPRPDTKRSGSFDERKKARLNELIQHFTVREDDNRPAEVQGLEEIQISLVKRKRTVILTDKPYPMLSFRHDLEVRRNAHLAGPSKADQKLYVIQNGPLVCRSSWTSVQSPNGKVYGGEWKYLSKKALSPPQQEQQSHAHGYTPLKLSHETAQRHARAMAESDRPRVYRFKLPSKNGRYIFIDVYCGAGGATQGARQAGLKILGGLDHDENAIQAWAENNPGAIYLNMDSFDFLSNENWKILGRCDILNISNPCQPFSPSHTIDGKNDAANIDQLHTIKGLIEVLKPRVVVLENTSGLVNLTENQPYFRKIIYDISSAGPGYNLRYNIINMADYGLPQERKRLIIIAAKRGLPLPPFPKPTHGPGLKPYVSIGHALEALERTGQRWGQDFYHKPHKQVRPSERLYDPYTKFVDCITTKGATCKHWSGEDFTPRELAMLQSLPHDYKLSGSWAQATKQLGNMWPPVSAEPVYSSCAQTLEAFDHGLIDADEDIDDINVTLIEKGVDIPGSSLASPSTFDAQDSVTASPYRYIKPPVLSDAVPVESSSAWAKRKFGEDDSVDDSDEEVVITRVEKRKQRKVITSTRKRNSQNGFNGTIDGSHW